MGFSECQGRGFFPFAFLDNFSILRCVFECDSYAKASFVFSTNNNQVPIRHGVSVSHYRLANPAYLSLTTKSHHLSFDPLASEIPRRHERHPHHLRIPPLPLTNTISSNPTTNFIAARYLSDVIQSRVVGDIFKLLLHYVFVAFEAYHDVEWPNLAKCLRNFERLHPPPNIPPFIDFPFIFRLSLHKGQIAKQMIR